MVISTTNTVQKLNYPLQAKLKDVLSMTTKVRGSSRKEKVLTVSLACMGRELQEKIQMLDQTRVIVREHPDHG